MDANLRHDKYRATTPRQRGIIRVTGAIVAGGLAIGAAREIAHTKPVHDLISVFSQAHHEPYHWVNPSKPKSGQDAYMLGQHGKSGGHAGYGR